MSINGIYAHARRGPERNAVVYNGHRMGYGQFARLIEASRAYLARRVPANGGIAVLSIGSLRDAWIQGLALRSLGLTTLIAPSPPIAALGLPAVACVVATEAEDRNDVEAECAAAGWPFIRVPRAAYASAAHIPLSDLREPAAPSGGHIFLSSGTTGVHKKVLVSPASAADYVAYRKEMFALTEQSVASVFHLGGWTGIGHNTPAATWDAGGCVVMCQGTPDHEALDYPGITLFHAPVNILAAVLTAPPGRLRFNPTMRIVTGAGPLSRKLAEEATARLTQQIHIDVGSTEVPIFGLTAVETEEDLVWHRIAEGREVQIVGDDGKVLPVGMVGHLRVRTWGVTGYLHDDEATRTFFRDGYFYTGDLGCLRADGRFMLQGRVTDLVNILGGKFAPDRSRRRSKNV